MRAVRCGFQKNGGRGAIRKQADSGATAHSVLFRRFFTIFMSVFLPVCPPADTGKGLRHALPFACAEAEVTDLLLPGGNSRRLLYESAEASENSLEPIQPRYGGCIGNAVQHSLSALTPDAAFGTVCAQNAPGHDDTAFFCPLTSSSLLPLSVDGHVS